jgi:hypothetical protein
VKSKLPLHTTWPVAVTRLQLRLVELDGQAKRAMAEADRLDLRARQGALLAAIEQLKATTIERELERDP